MYGLNQLGGGYIITLEEANFYMYGIDFEGPLPSEMYDGEIFNEFSIDVPPVANPLNDSQLSLLSSMVDPLVLSSSYGLDIYLNTVQLVTDLVQSGKSSNWLIDIAQLNKYKCNNMQNCQY